MTDRKTDKTASKKAAFLRVLEAQSGNVSHTCKALKIGSRQTYYTWLKEDPDFAQAVDDIQEGLIDWGEGLLRQRMTRGDTTAIIFFLKTKGKNRGYVERQEMAHSGGGEKGELLLKVIHTQAGDKGNGNGGNGGEAK